jgi:hypothetical protein
MTSPHLDVYDIAFLAGGADRMVDTALVALVQSGRVRAHPSGRFATVGLTRRHPVEAAVLDAVGPTGHRSIDTIRWRLADDDRLRDVEDRLRHAGLLRGRWPGRGRVLDRRPPTVAGRRILRQLAADPPADAVAAGTDAMSVALGGRERLADRAPNAAIFDAPRRLRLFRRGSRSARRDEAAAEAWQEVQRTTTVVYGFTDELYAPSGPTAARISQSHRNVRRERGAR